MKINEDYKQMVLANAIITNTIYLTTSNKDGTMSAKRRDFTEEVLRATVENMIGHAEQNGRAVFSWRTNKYGVATLAYIPNHLHDSFLNWCDEVGYGKIEETSKTV